MKQVAAIERVDRLRRFLGPQVAQVIASSDAPDSILASHRREVTVRSATCADSAQLTFRYEGTLERFAGGGIHDYLQRSDPLSRSYRLSCLDMREKMAELAKEASRVPRPSRYRGRACAQDRQWTLLQERGAGAQATPRASSLV